MLQTENLSFRYTKETPLFHFPNITLENEEKLLILGKSGVGKSTFLHLLSGLLVPQKGSVKIEGVDLLVMHNNQLDQFRGQNIGLVFQKKHALQSLTLYDNLKARLYFAKKIH